MPSPALFSQLDLNLLKVFEALYHHRNMTRTASALHLTPSAISHAVKRMRVLLDDPLFERHGNMMTPTPACERLAPGILTALSSLRKVFQEWDRFVPITSRQTFVIAMPEALELIVLPPLLAVLQQQAPLVNLSSVRLERSQGFRDLATGQVSLALDVARPVSVPIQHRLLQRDQYCVLMSQDHPFASNPSQDTYLNSAHVSVSNRAQGATVEELALQQLGVDRPSQWRCQHYRAAVDVAVHSEALLTIPTTLANALRSDLLVQRSLPFELPPIETHLYWHQQVNDEPSQQWLRTKMFDVFGGQGDGLLTPNPRPAP